jgi:hypothetical protein
MPCNAVESRELMRFQCKSSAEHLSDAKPNFLCLRSFLCCSLMSVRLRGHRWLQIGELTARPFELLCRDLNRVSDGLHKQPSAIAIRTLDASVKSERQAELTLPSFASFVTDLVGYAHASYPTGAAAAVPSGEYSCSA